MFLYFCPSWIASHGDEEIRVTEAGTNGHCILVGGNVVSGASSETAGKDHFGSGFGFVPIAVIHVIQQPLQFFASEFFLTLLNEVKSGFFDPDKCVHHVLLEELL